MLIMHISISNHISIKRHRVERNRFGSHVYGNSPVTIYTNDTESTGLSRCSSYLNSEILTALSLTRRKCLQNLVTT